MRVKVLKEKLLEALSKDDKAVIEKIKANSFGYLFIDALTQSQWASRDQKACFHSMTQMIFNGSLMDGGLKDIQSRLKLEIGLVERYNYWIGNKYFHCKHKEDIPAGATYISRDPKSCGYMSKKELTTLIEYMLTIMDNNIPNMSSQMQEEYFKIRQEMDNKSSDKMRKIEKTTT